MACWKAGTDWRLPAIVSPIPETVSSYSCIGHKAGAVHRSRCLAAPSSSQPAALGRRLLRLFKLLLLLLLLLLAVRRLHMLLPPLLRWL